VPDGFATTASAYWQFIDANGLRDRITETLAELEEEAIGLRNIIVMIPFCRTMAEADR
jgi:pyruvate, water dikinase